MREDVYLHSLCTGTLGYSSKKTLKLLERILISGSLLSARGRGSSYIYNFAGIDYISLADFEKRELYKGDYYNGYYQYSLYDSNLVFPKGEFDVIEPIIIGGRIDEYQYPLMTMQEYGLMEQRYSDLLDEVQVKDELSLDYMCALTLPCREFINYWLNESKNIDIVKREVEKYKELLIKYGRDVPIYDIATLKNIEIDDNVGLVVRQLTQKNKLF